ncbi:MAG TPA: class I SAM-dependent methyltransferase [Acidimicrobiales bacterium]|nr:class I SAM-dependent methyltransferase [Acidimicrobiales bacterium]
MRTTLNLYPFGESFHHGEVDLAQNRVRLKFQVGEGVFSAASVDVGTRLLLRTLAGPEHATRSRVLDLGCGYGPLGLTLASMAPRQSVDLVDRDAVALAYARLNADQHQAGSIRVEPGLGWADIPEDRTYDLVVSNIPAKVGPAAVESWLLDGRPHLDPDGLVAVVVINRLEEEVDRVLSAAGIEVLLRQANRGHVAIHYRLGTDSSPRPRPRMAVQDRGRAAFSAGKVKWTARTAWGVPEFDSLHHATKLALRAVREIHRRPSMHAAVIGTGIGHGTLALREAVRPEELHLFDRDLLALRVTAANLADAGFPRAALTLHHTPLVEAPPASLDVCLAVFTTPVPQKVVDAVVASCAAALRPAGRLIVAGTSTAVTRTLEKLARSGLPLVAVGRAREKAHSAADLVRRPD